MHDVMLTNTVLTLELCINHNHGHCSYNFKCNMVVIIVQLLHLTTIYIGLAIYYKMFSLFSVFMFNAYNVTSAYVKYLGIAIVQFEVVSYHLNLNNGGENWCQSCNVSLEN